MKRSPLADPHSGAQRRSQAWLDWQADLTNHSKLNAYLAELGSDKEARDHATAVFRHHVANQMSLLRDWADAFTTQSENPSDYLDLLERVVCNWIYMDPNITLSKLAPFDEHRRSIGKDIPQVGHTMIGRTRLAHLRWAVEHVLDKGVPGDLLEAGVWRGGACILMKGVLKDRGDRKRTVIVADSFEGLPPPDSRYPEDTLSEFDFHLRPELSVSLEEVQDNFRRYGLLDDRVYFAKGLFQHTLPALAGRTFAVLRLDGDLFSSTMDALRSLYDSVSPGGIIIIDDYGSVIDCRRAVAEFRVQRGIQTELFTIDDDGVFWIK